MMVKFRTIRFAETATRLQVLGLILFILYACVSGHHKPFIETPPPLRNIAAFNERLQRAVRSSNLLSLEEIGQVTYPNFKAPLWKISFKPYQPVEYRVWINAAIHGNEPASAEFIAQFVEQLAQSPHTYEQTAFDIIPIVNPWGWVHDIRFNKDGIDINRDFATFKSQEARSIKNILIGSSYHLMLDLHEDRSAKGFYLYQYGLSDQIVCRRIVATIRQMGYPIEQNVNMVILKTKDGIIDAPMLGLWYMRLTGQLSIANYYRLANSQAVFTVETPESLLWEDRLRMQKTAVEMLIENFAK